MELLGKDYRLWFVMLKGAESFGVISGIMGKNIKEIQIGLLSCEKKTNIMNMKGD